MKYPIRYRAERKFVTQRRAVTSRASRIFVSPPVVRKQAAAMSGQICVAQPGNGAWTCRRSPLASAAVSLASTLGARAGKAITEAPRSATTARAERDLSMWGTSDFGCLDPAFGDTNTNNQSKK